MSDENNAFWDKKAETFPRYEPGENTYEAGMLNRIKAHGVDFQGRDVLDVGCGSGMYTLRIAQEARRVTALDISKRMLEILREDAEKLGLGNIEYVRSDWDAFQSDATYDILFCSMTPALKSDEARLKLLRHARGWIVFMGFAGLMSSNMLNGLFEKFQVTPKYFTEGTETREWLEKRGAVCKRSLVEGKWVVKRGLEETISDCTAMLMPYGVTLERSFLEDYLASFEEEPGVYVERTDYKIELLVWENEAPAVS